MLGSTFDKSIELFDRRFVTNAYLPMLLATAGFAVVGLSGSGGLELLTSKFDGLSPIAQAGVLLGWLGASWFLAGMLWNSRYSITRIFEGYPIHGRAGLWGAADRRLTRRQREAAEFFDGPVRYMRYPMRPDEFLPTSFGNAMRASEFYSSDRYGMDLIVMWPRLAAIAPDRHRQDVDEARSEYEFLLCLSFLGAAFGSLSGIFLVIVDGPLPVYLAAVPTTLGLAYLAYRLAVFAAIDFGGELRVLVDVCRLEAMASLGWPVPMDEEAERECWTEVNEFLSQGEPVPGGRPMAAIPHGPKESSGSQSKAP